MNFVALCRENAAPSSNGRCSSGVANVESTATGDAATRTARRARHTSSSGLLGDSSHSRSAPSHARKVASVSVVSTVASTIRPARGALGQQRTRPRVARHRADHAGAERQRLQDRRRRRRPAPERDGPPALQRAHRFLEAPPRSARPARARSRRRGSSTPARAARSAARPRREAHDRREWRASSGPHLEGLQTICNHARHGERGCRDHRRRRRRSQRRLPPRRGRRAGRALRARPARLGLDVEGRRRRPRAVQRPAQHPDRPAQPRALQGLPEPPGLGDRPARGRLPVPAHARGRGRGLHAQRRAPERARRALADDLAGRGARSCARCSRSTTCWPPATRPRTGTRRPNRS